MPQSAATDAIDRMLSGRNGASGTGQIRIGSPTSNPCRAPGISLVVQTTSGPKYGQAPVAE